MNNEQQFSTTTEPTPSPRRYLSKAEQTVVVRLIQKMIGLGKFTSEIKTAIAARYNLSRRSATRYLHRARHEMQEFVERDDDLHRTESFYFYLSVIENPDSTGNQRLRARERIDRIMGIELPNQYHQKRKFSKSVEEIKSLSDEEFQAYYDKLMRDVT
ncbi:hypothetical protein Pan153_57840 [Gimesia panareensis]|uniref:Uncharacterized protein n=1 Tax=Gimesia panareensis TaxID=2527978 RepID=A0A518FXM9_9PLAN|nr:hypothetical protein [Gimesia panareensis]QDV21102.1 hypothetical protein Pan153_57840 [Gimesia panareensis]